MPYILTAMIGALVAAKGGFFNAFSCMAGAVMPALAVPFLIDRVGRAKAMPAIFLPLCMPLAYLASAITNGLNLTTLAEAGSWSTFASACVLVALMDEGERTRAFVLVAWLGVLTAVAGMLCYVGLLPLELGMLDDRLQFSFQYANAAAAWYGACTLLCLLAPESKLRSATPLPATALLLTLSGGGTLAFLLVSLVVGLRLVWEGEWGRLFSSLLRGMVAVASFAVVHIGQGRPAFAAVVLLAVLVCWCSYRYERVVENLGSARVLSLCLVAAYTLGLFAVPTLLPSRVSSALSTFVERGYQVRDGLALWLGSPMLGVGPDMWQHVYQDVQTAPYHSAVVHCSYVQVLVDAGFLGLISLLLVITRGLKSVASIRDEWADSRLAAALLILAHSFVDFDLRFSSITCLLAALIAVPGGEGVHVKAKVRDGRQWVDVLSLCFPFAVCTVLGVTGARCSLMSEELAAANEGGSPAQTAALFESSALASRDPSAQAEYLQALHDLGDLVDVPALYERIDHPNDKASAYAAISLFEQGNRLAAGELLLERMEAQPYNNAAFENANTLFSTYGIDSSLEGRYRMAIDRTNHLLAEADPRLVSGPVDSLV